jgi:hypothetical protein
MWFERREHVQYADGSSEHGLWAVDPHQGNDAALLAVFDNPHSPTELARFLNWSYEQYIRGTPMRPTFVAETLTGEQNSGDVGESCGC